MTQWQEKDVVESIVLGSDLKVAVVREFGQGNPFRWQISCEVSGTARHSDIRLVKALAMRRLKVLLETALADLRRMERTESRWESDTPDVSPVVSEQVH